MKALVAALDERVNPILLKEMRQGLRSRWLSWCIHLGLLGLLLTYALIPTFSNGSGSSGKALFGTITVLTFGLTWVVLPISASRQLAGEITSRTLELTLLTRLTAHQSVSGRLQGSLLKLLLWGALVGPFAVASIQLGGVDIRSLLISLVGILVFAVPAQSVGILVGALAVLGSRLSVALLVMFIGAMLSVTSGGLGVVFQGELFSSLKLELWLLLLLSAAVPTAISLTLAADLLGPVGLRSFGISKLTFFTCICLIAALLAAGYFAGGPLADDDAQAVCLGVTLGGLLSISALWCAAPALRENASVPWHDRWFLLRNGYTSVVGYLFVACAALTPMAFHAQTPLVPFAAWVYFVAFTGVARGASHVARPELRPQVFLVCLVVLLTGNVLAMAFLASASLERHPLAQALCPLLVLDSSRSIREPILILVPLLAGMAGILFARRVEHSERGVQAKP